MIMKNVLIPKRKNLKIFDKKFISCKQKHSSWITELSFKSNLSELLEIISYLGVFTASLFSSIALACIFPDICDDMIMLMIMMIIIVIIIIITCVIYMQ